MNKTNHATNPSSEELRRVAASGGARENRAARGSSFSGGVVLLLEEPKRVGMSRYQRRRNEADKAYYDFDFITGAGLKRFVKSVRRADDLWDVVFKGGEGVPRRGLGVIFLGGEASAEYRRFEEEMVSTF
jgi:hypothetical protein